MNHISGEIIFIILHHMIHSNVSDNKHQCPPMEKTTKHEFVDQVSEDYICKQCDTVAREPNITSCCGESLCQSCVNTINQNKSSCPSCEQTDFSAFLHRKYKAKISALRVRCTMKVQGCEWIGKFRELDGHLDVAEGNCMYVTVDCPQNCEDQVQKLNIEKHISEECPNRNYTCPHCSLQDTFRAVNEHFDVCQYYPIVCGNRCGATFERGELEDHRKMCSLEKIECEFRFAGCMAEFIREKRDEHMSVEQQKHLSLVAKTLREGQERTEKTLTEQEERHALKLKEALDEQKKEFEQQMAKHNQQALEREKQQRQDFEKQLKERDDKIKQCEGKIEEITKKLEKKPKKHIGKFHCCTWCSTGGKKNETCGCGSRMPGGYSGCGHGHPGHPGGKHWSCCGSTVESSDCLA